MSVPSNEQNNSLFRLHVVIVVVLVAGAAFLAGVWFAGSADSPHDDEDFEVFWQSWDILEDEYYYDLPDDDKALVYGAIRGLVSVAEDRYTFFVPPTAAEIDRQTTAGEFGGIGVYISPLQNGQYVVSDPFEGMPAAEAGLETGDVIVEVDNVAIEGMGFEDVLGLLRGDIGTEVRLLMYRPAEDRQFTVEIMRVLVQLPTVEARMIDDVAYARLYGFNDRATSALQAEIADLLAESPRALILDLRNNPGGLLDQAIGVSDLFLNEGLVLTQRDRHGNEQVYRSSDGEIAEQIPLVVLLDGGSASASEVVAGALRDRDRAVLIGQTSFGKGSVQLVHDLADGSQLHVTAALWFTPNETPIQGQGLTPDVVVEADPVDEEGQDTYIQAALGYIDQHYDSE